MTSTGSSLSLNTKIIISTAAIAGIATCGYYYYRKYHSNRTSSCKSSLWSSSCLYVATKNWINVTRNYLSPFSCLDKKDSSLNDNSFQNGSVSTVNVSLAKSKKSQGNKLFAEGNPNEAISCYTEAINNLPMDHPERSACYCNRAACYLSQGLYKSVIDDCNEALKLSPLYLKAFERRSRAHEALNHLEEALTDLTACCIIDGFTSQAFPQRLEKLLRVLSQTRAVDIIKNKTPSFPSKYSIAEFFKGIPIIIEDEEEYDNPIIKSLQRVKKMIHDENAPDAFSLLLELSASAIPSEISDEISFYLACLHLLRGNLDESTLQYNKISTERFPIAHVIRASILLERSLLVEAKEEIEKAIATSAAMEISSNQTLAYLYFHLGQCEAIMGNTLASISAYDKAIKILPGVIHFYIHKSRAAIAYGNIEEAEGPIQEALSRFPGSPEVLNAYGEFLIIKGASPNPTIASKSVTPFELARSTLRNALSACAAGGTTGPIPSIYLNLAALDMYVINSNAAMAFDSEELKTLRQESISYLMKAIELDPLYDAAHVQLAHLLMTNGKNSEALEHFDKAIESCKTFQDVAQIVSLKLACEAQLKACDGNLELETRIRMMLTNGGYNEK